MKSKAQNKSQITMLMVIGLVLFIIVGLVLYLSKSSVRKQSQQVIKRAQETAIDTQPIKGLVAKCLDKLAKDAIVLLGKQGGYIYASQGGTLVDHLDTDDGLFFVKHNNLNVAYNILPPRFAVPPYSSHIPDYPWKTFPYKATDLGTETFEGFFGISNMPPLNSSEGPNSIQTQIETFIDSNMRSCADFSLFKNQGYIIEMNNSKTHAVVGSGDITIKSNIPVGITNSITKEAVELKEFSTNVNIRLRDVYFFTKEAVENEIKNIKFDIEGAQNNDGMSIKLVKDVFYNDDLVIVTDEKSLVYGRPYEYIFSRRNRAPALYYINKTTLEYAHLHVITQSDLLQGSELHAEDPDEDNYTFTITPQLPKVLDVPQIKFRIEVSDGKLSDYQTIIVDRIIKE